MSGREASRQVATGPVEVTRSEERLRVDSDWLPVERVVVRRQTVSEVVQVQVEVTVRREVLVVERTPMTGARSRRSVPAPVEPLVVVLREEVPVVGVATRGYERVTVAVEQVTERQTYSAGLGSEQVDVIDIAADDRRRDGPAA